MMKCLIISMAVALVAGFVVAIPLEDRGKTYISIHTHFLIITYYIEGKMFFSGK